MVKFLLVDDHAIVRKGLKSLIESFLPHAKVEESSNGDMALEKIKADSYDLVVLDVNMPETDSLGLVSNILSVKTSQKIIMFSINSEEIYAKRYLKIGARGYLRKDAQAEEIQNAILTVLNNKRYISAGLKENLLKSMHENEEPENPFNKLSAREFEIVQHLCRGDSVASISQVFKLHTSTVGTHKARIFQKLKCLNVVELSNLAKLHRLI